MEPASELDALLRRHKQALRVGDKRLADLSNDYAGIPLVNRSSIRNWSNGTTQVVRDWRQVVAVAAGLRLNAEETNELLRASGCGDLAELRESEPEHRALLRYWDANVGPDLSEDSPAGGGLAEPPSASTSLTDQEPRIDLSDARQPNAIGATPAPGRSINANGDGTCPAEEADRAAKAEHGALPVELGRSRLLLLLPVILAVLAIVIAVYPFFSPTDALSPVVDPDAPPVTTIDAPSQGSVVGESFVASGTAAQSAGVSHVEAVLVDIDRSTYWNPDSEVWQEKWRLFTIPVSDPGAASVTWEVPIGKDFPLLPGNYRLRTWTRSSSNRGDPVGPLVEFTVSDKLAPQDKAKYERAQEVQTNPVPDPLTRQEQIGDIPTARSQYPSNGASVYAGFRLLAHGEYEKGLALLEVELRDLTTDRYWNFDAQRWQTSPSSLELTPESEECGKCTEMTYDIWMPTGSADIGEYQLRTVAIGVDGVSFEEGHTSEFSVIGP